MMKNTKNREGGFRMTYHNPVLLSESVAGLIGDVNGSYVDVTYGGGGHSQEIMNHLQNGKLVAFDQDSDCESNLIKDENFLFVPQNFRFLKKFLQYYNIFPVDGILADLGVSSHQFDTPERGFSHRFDGMLDMRMNASKGITAGELINNYPEEKLTEIFFRYGELQQAKRIAQQIVRERQKRAIYATSQLVEIVKPILQYGKENKDLSKLFQAIRIEVNKEMDALQEFLLQALDSLKPGGRLVVISYHSLEDRMVKNFMKSGNFDGDIKKDFYGNILSPFKQITKKAIVPSDNEILINPRARSAKLRIAAKL